MGALGEGKLHGFAVAKRLSRTGDIGRVWTLSRPLTYRALGTLIDHGMIRELNEEPSDSGPNRVLLGTTPKGRGALKAWLRTPVQHPRDVRSELLLKIVLSDLNGLDRSSLVASQIEVFTAYRGDRIIDVGTSPVGSNDPVALWRREFAEAAIRFLTTLPKPVA